MNGLKGAKLGLGVAAAAAFALGVSLLASPQVSAQGEALSVSRTTAAPGEQGAVELAAFNIPAPGLGAWTIDVAYDPAVVTAVACTAESAEFNVCNEAFSSNTVRVAGAHAGTPDLVGTTVLARIVFECGDTEGASDLTVSVGAFMDATVGGPQPIDVEFRHGMITCAQEGPPPATATPHATEAAATPAADGLPDAGTGGVGPGGGSELNWLVAALATAALAALACFGALRLHTTGEAAEAAMMPVSRGAALPNALVAGPSNGRRAVSWRIAVVMGGGLAALACVGVLRSRLGRAPAGRAHRS